MTINYSGNIQISAVEESLSSLGESSKQAIFFYLETSFQIEKAFLQTSLDLDRLWKAFLDPERNTLKEPSQKDFTKIVG